MTTLQLPFAVRPLLAVGGELKNAFCLARDHSAWMSDLNGDMDTIEALTRFETALADLQAQTDITPELVACDLHPGYRSTRWAAGYAQARGLPLVKVQHHHAHIAAVMAEHGLKPDAQVIGVALDGTGYGTDGAIWGGEVLVAGYGGFTRAAHLKYAPLPGGDAAIRKPYRLALAHLWAAGIAWDDDLPPVQACSETERGILIRQIERSINTVSTSSMGRLFDAVASLVGVRQVVDYEAQAAIELQQCAVPETETPYTFGIEPSGEPLQIDPAPLFRAIIEDWRKGTPTAQLSAWFHLAVAEVLASIAVVLRERTGISTTALSGGVFQNRLLLAAACHKLNAAGFEVLTHEKVSPSDSGIALGQAAAAHFQQIQT
ncbi:MAG: carbamoyltransferase HypF [Anaerolineae bacterium]|nr:carbamoyltransferase HypF [Anaerolineae bacterium]